MNKVPPLRRSLQGVSARHSDRRASQSGKTQRIHAARSCLALLSVGSNYCRAGNIVLALIFVLAAFMTAAALLARTQGTYLGAFFSGESREAREAGEYGVRTIISELARTPNRRLLVANQLNTSWIAPSGWAQSSNLAATQNPCSVNSASSLVPPTAIAGATTTDGSKATVGSQANKTYWLRSVTYLNEASSGSRSSVSFSRSSPGAWSAAQASGSYDPAAVSLNGVTRAYIKLQVQGESVEKGKTSTALVSKEFELIPKCCGRSFGYTYATIQSPVASFGQDLRSCPPVTLGLLNLVTGANKNGLFNTNGNAFNLWENVIGTNQDQAITLNPADAKAIDSDTQLVYSGQSLPPQVPSSDPTIFANSGCISGNADITLPSGGDGTNEATACPDGALPEDVYQVQGGKATITSTTTGSGSNKVTTYTYSCDAGQYSVPPNTATPLPSGAKLVASNNVNTDLTGGGDYEKCYVKTTRTTGAVQPYCLEFPSSSNRWYCKIRYVNTNGRVTVDSSGGKTVTLLFSDITPTGNGGGAIAGGSSAFSGNGGYAHVSDACTPSPLCTTAQFRIVNNVVGSSFQLTGATGALAGFFDLRYSNVTIKGGGSNSTINLSGILWTNTLNLAGNAVLVNPPSGVCDGLTTPAAGTTCAILKAIYPGVFDTSTTNDETRPAFDFTPRSIFSLNFF